MLKIYHYLKCHILWNRPTSTREDTDATMPKDFQDLYPRTRVVIDYTELFTQSLQSLAEQSLMHSNDKASMILKALVGITPSGVVSFVSDL